MNASDEPQPMTSFAAPPLLLALLLGGDSTEREISFKTAVAMYEALNKARYEIHLFDVTARDAPPASAALNETLLSFSEYSQLENWWRELAQNGGARRVSWAQLGGALSGFAVALPALHGSWGEDGTLQALLQIAGVPCAGSSQSACVVAMDKQLCKIVAREAGVNVPRGVRIHKVDASLQMPFSGACVVKPNGGGSSVGVTITPDASDEIALRNAVAAALQDGGDALIEELIVGCEVTAAVVGEGEAARALPLIEIVPQDSGEFYDYAAKYAAGGSRHLIPPRLSQAAQDAVLEAALRVHRALGCRGVTRSDFLVDENDTPYFLEINTLPGMTKTSLVPDAARAAGLDFDELVETLVSDALLAKPQP